MTTFKQYELYELSDDDPARLVCWLEEGRVKVGDVITLKETGDRKWRVGISYRKTLDGAALSESRRWTVGGL